MDEDKKPVEEKTKEEVKEVKVEPENNKTNPIMIILIAVFLISFIAGCVFTVKNLTNKNKNNTETNTEPKNNNEPDKIEELKEIDVKGYNEIIEKIDFAKDLKTDLDVTGLDNQQILRIGLDDEFTNKGYFTKDELKKSIKAQLGDVSYNDEPIKCLVCGNSVYKYSAEEGVYEEAPSIDHGHGPAGTLYKQKYFVSASKNETKGTLDIKYKILYGEYQDESGIPSSNVYLSAEDAANRKNGLLATNDNGYDKEAFDKAYEDNKDKIPVTTYSFVKDSDGNFVFKKVSVN